jgi:hypothetical protein
MSEVNLGGCPPKYTPERTSAILQSISNRIPYELAAEANGISERCLYLWLNKGEEESELGLGTPLAQFFQAIKKIEQERITYHLSKIADNVERWQSDAWILERRWYKYFGANVQLKDMDERIKQIESKGKDAGNGQEA